MARTIPGLACRCNDATTCHDPESHRMRLPQRDLGTYRDDDGSEVVCADCRSPLSEDDAGVLLGVERCAECERRFALRAVVAVEFLGRPLAERLEILTAAMTSLASLETELLATLRLAAEGRAPAQIGGSL